MKKSKLERKTLMKKMKKTLCLLLMFMVAAMAFPTVSFGANEIVSQDGNWRYIPDYNKDTCTVIGYYGSDADVSIPSVVDDLKVTRLDFQFQVAAPHNRWMNPEPVVSITIPSTVTSLGNFCFAELPNLKKITIPSSVKEFGKGLFDWCTSLEEFTIPANMKEIPSETFENCTSLSKVTIHSKVTSIDYLAFAECTSLKQIKLPSGLKSIGGQCFFGSGLESLSIPNTVSDLGGGICDYCTNLTSVKFTTNANVKELPYNSFYRCSNLKTITIPSNIKSMYSGFSECPNLTTVIVRNDNLDIIGGLEQTAVLTAYSSSKATKLREYCSKKGIRWKPLDPPTWISKKRTDTTASLKWKSVTDAVGYKVYKKTGSGSYKLLKTVTGTSYKATGLKKGTTYRFYVTTLKEDALGNLIESKGSSVYKTYLKKS